MTPEVQAHSPDEAADLELWRALVAGDEAAFEKLFRRHAAPRCGFANSYLDDRDASEDVVHSIFCGLWHNRAELKEPRSVRGYLFTAVRNRAKNHRRDERARTLVLDRLQAEQGIGTETDAGHDDRIERIKAEVRRLPTRCREVVVLVRYNGMRQAEAAAVLGISPKTVEIHLGRAMKILRERLNPGGPKES